MAGIRDIRIKTSPPSPPEEVDFDPFAIEPGSSDGKEAERLNHEARMRFMGEVRARAREEAKAAAEAEQAEQAAADADAAKDRAAEADDVRTNDVEANVPEGVRPDAREEPTGEARAKQEAQAVPTCTPAGPASSASGSPAPQAPPPCPADSDFALLLGDHGPFSSRIWEAADSHSALRDRLLRDLREVGEDYRMAPDHNRDRGQPMTPAEQFTVALAGSNSLPTIDPVLAFCLARQAKLDDLAHRLRPLAWREYLQQPAAYDGVLGELIPAAYRDRARQLAADNAYHKGENSTAAQDWAVYRDGLRKRRQAPSQGLPTGLPAVDAALWGGLRGLTFLAGADGAGKTALTLAFARAALQRDPAAAVLYYSLELSRTVILDRLLAAEAGVDYRTLLADERSEDEDRRLVEAEERLVSGVLPRLRILDRPALGSPERLTSQLALTQRAELLNQSGARKCLVVVDSFQHFRPAGIDPTSLAADHHRLEILKEIQDATVTVTWPQGGPLLVVCEVRKEAGGADLGMADLLGSTHLKYAPDAVLFLEAGNGTAPSTGVAPRVLAIEKGREGVEHARIPLAFDFRVYRFREAAATAGVAAAGKGTGRNTGQRKLKPRAKKGG
jgi:hypothetical protein